MKINKLGDVIGAVAQQAIVEGRAVMVVPNTISGYNFGSRTDLPGVRLPTSSAEASAANYIVAWTPDNTEPPIYEPYPALEWSLRYGGFDQTANVPFDAKVRMTAPSVQQGQTIPSGYLALAHTQGTYELVSGEWVTASVAVGSYLIPEYASGASRGKLKYSATATNYQVIGLDSTNSRITVKSIL